MRPRVVEGTWVGFILSISKENIPKTVGWAPPTADIPRYTNGKKCCMSSNGEGSNVQGPSPREDAHTNHASQSWCARIWITPRADHQIVQPNLKPNKNCSHFILIIKSSKKNVSAHPVVHAHGDLHLDDRTLGVGVEHRVVRVFLPILVRVLFRCLPKKSTRQEWIHNISNSSISVINSIINSINSISINSVLLSTIILLYCINSDGHGVCLTSSGKNARGIIRIFHGRFDRGGPKMLKRLDCKWSTL